MSGFFLTFLYLAWTVRQISELNQDTDLDNLLQIGHLDQDTDLGHS